jgi:hypothetical protein
MWRFARAGALMDLNGTAVAERYGHTGVEAEVEIALKRLRELGRRFALDTLRFPRSVVETLGTAWSATTDAPPLVSVYGPLTGLLVTTRCGGMDFDPSDVFPLNRWASPGSWRRSAPSAPPVRGRCCCSTTPGGWRAGERIGSDAALRACSSVSTAHGCGPGEL